jgi:uncharacterized secreted protein with C-terminal beta-propeller domain
MKIAFDDGSYIDCRKDNDKIIIIIASKDSTNPLRKIINSVEITTDEFKKLIGDVV